MTDQSPTREELIERLEKLIAPSHRRVWNDVISNYEYQFQPPAKVQLSSDDLAALISLLRSDSQRIAELEGRLKASRGEVNSIACGSVEASTPLSAGWRDISSVPKDRTRVDLFDGRNINPSCRWMPMELDGYGWDNSWTGFRPTHWRPIEPPAKNGADVRPEGVRLSATDEQIDPALQTQGARPAHD